MISTTIETGRKGEDLACTYLQSHGYRILNRNFRHMRYEIDIVAWYEGVLVFVEVKTRALKALDIGVELRPAQMRRIVYAANSYVYTQRPSCKETRFDLIKIRGIGKHRSIEHIIDAFDPATATL